VLVRTVYIMCPGHAVNEVSELPQAAAKLTEGRRRRDAGQTVSLWR